MERASLQARRRLGAGILASMWEGIHRSTLAILLALIGLFLALHLSVLEIALPHAKEPDAALVRQSLLLRNEGPWDDHAWAKYPHLVPALIALVPRAEGLPDASELDSGRLLQAHLEFASRHLVAARLVIVLLSAAAIPLCFLLARRFLDRPWSLVATALFASSLLLHNFAHQARPHAAVVAPVLGALLACHQWAVKGRARDLVLATIGCGLALASLHSGAFVLIGACVALGLRMRSEARPRVLSLAGAVASLAFCVWLAYPFFFDEPRAGGAFESGLGTYAMPHRVGIERFTGAGFGRMATALWSYDPTLAVAGAAGLLTLLVARLHGREAAESAVWRCPRAPWVLLAPALAYTLVLGAYEKTFERFLIPMLPFLCVLSAGGIAGLARYGARLATSLPRLAHDAAWMGLVLSFTFWPCVHLARLRARPDVQTEAARWVSEHVDPEQQRVAISPHVNLPLAFPIVQADRVADSPLKLTWTRYLAELEVGDVPRPLAPVFPLGPGGRLPMTIKEYAITPGAARERLRELRPDFLILEQGSSIGRGVRNYASQRARFVTRIQPWPTEVLDPAGLTYSSDRFRAELLAAERLGPVLEIWEL